MHSQILQKHIDKFFRSWQYHKMAEFGYRIFKSRTCEGYTKKAILRYKKSTKKKPTTQIKREIKLCKKFWGCYPVHYFRYNLFLETKKLSQNQLINYIPEYFFYNIFLPHYDSYKYKTVLEDKIFTDQIFKSLQIPTPPNICYLIKNNMYDNNYKKTEFKKIENIIKDMGIENIIMKPVYGGGGRGINIFKINNNNKHKTKNGIFFDESFLKKKGSERDYILQAGIKQNKFLSKIYANSINTIRIITQNFFNNVNIIFCILRMGRDGREIDNFSQNGICVEINKNTGELCKHAASKQCEYFFEHPNSKFIFENKKIPQWNKIKNLVKYWAQKLPKFTYLGWDIALSNNGPLVIEVNLGFGLDGIQILAGGMRNDFQIENPKIYWKKK
jgi:hypothetical protein